MQQQTQTNESNVIELANTLYQRECDVINLVDILDSANLAHDCELDRLRNRIVQNLERSERLMVRFRREVRAKENGGNGHDAKSTGKR